VTPQQLVEFEEKVAKEFEAGKIKGPIHLSGGNEEQVIEIFKEVSRDDWVFSTWRNHYHALLHGVPEEKLMSEIMAGRSMNLTFPEHRFYTSAIVGGILPIATGVAAALKRKGCHRKVWCFFGDMTSHTGIAWESWKYASKNDLPITFVQEDNGFSTNTPTSEVCGVDIDPKFLKGYWYERTKPHSGVGKWVQF
jgi:TPP-dependent pyruvate/acetoin dehydrogenase alpha subunit